jgi:hypothetical protein
MIRRPSVARVKLARSLPRLLAVPFLLFGLAGAGIAAGVLGVTPAPASFAIIAIAGALGAIGLALMVTLLTVRLDIEESAVQVSWIGGSRLYVLSPGPVTRVRLRGPTASRLRVRSGAFGWSLGRATLRGEEPIHIVRLAPTATAILVPTDQGRLAIAPARDEDLLGALSRAARARQQLEAQTREAAEPVEIAAQSIEPQPVEPPPAIAAVQVPERPLTGIERALLEQELAQRAAAAESAGTDAVSDADVPVVADVRPVEPEPAPIAAAAAIPAVEAGPVRERRRIRLGQPGARAAFVLLPMFGAGLVWGVGLATGTMPQPGTDLARLTSLALVMAGPATSVGAVMAMAWWPRLVGVVVTGGLVASVFIGRALIAS